MDFTPSSRHDEPDWHGWSSGDASLHVGHLPGRKQVCLYEVRAHKPHGSSIHVLAFFKTEELALRALELLDRVASAKGAA